MWRELKQVLHCRFVRVILWFHGYNCNYGDMSALLSYAFRTPALNCVALACGSTKFHLVKPSCTHSNNRRYRVGELPVFPAFHLLSHFLSFVRMFRFHFLSPSTVSLSQHSHCNALPPLEVVPCVEAPLIPVCLQSPARLNFSLHQLEGCQRSNCQG